MRILRRIEKEYRRILLGCHFKRYVSLITEDHPFYSFPKNNAGDYSADPKEFFNHYDAFSFWLSEKLHGMGNTKTILDLGNRKVTNAILSLSNDVTSLVLGNCCDTISNVKYIKHDIANPLPFGKGRFDVFTSTVTLHLVGLGRYGDKLDPDALLKFIVEINRVMKSESHLIFSIAIGRNCLHFNNGWSFEFDTVLQLFKDWKLVDFVVDNCSGENPVPHENRFTKAINYDSCHPSMVAFYHFTRG